MSPLARVGALLATTSCTEALQNGTSQDETTALPRALADGVTASIIADRTNGYSSIIASDGEIPSGTVTGWLVDGQQRFPIVENGDDGYIPNARHASLGRLLMDDGVCPGGGCVHFTGYGQSDFAFTEKPAWANDRIELVIERGGTVAATPQAMRFAQKRYLRFYMRLGPDFQPPAPGTEMIVSQVWQISETGAPPFAIFLTVDPTGCPQPQPAAPAPTSNAIIMQFRYHNDDEGRNFLCHVISKTVWNDFIIMMIPRHLPFTGWSTDNHGSTRGAILVWKGLGLGPAGGVFDDTKALNYSATDDTRYRFWWGYREDPNWASDPSALGDRFDIRVGLYRNQPAQHAPIWFRYLKLTTTETAVPSR